MQLKLVNPKYSNYRMITHGIVMIILDTPSLRIASYLHIYDAWRHIPLWIVFW
jgi:hypothetical protein